MRPPTKTTGCPIRLQTSSPPPVREAYHTSRGIMWEGTAEAFLSKDVARHYRGKVQLILTSPPFPLNRKKKYGNLRGDAYAEWLG